MLGVTGQLAGSGPLGLRPSSSSARRLRPSTPAVARPRRLTATAGSTRSVPQLHSGFAREAPSAPSAAAPPAPAQRGGGAERMALAAAAPGALQPLRLTFGVLASPAVAA